MARNNKTAKENLAYHPTRLYFSADEYDLIKSVGESMHICKDSTMLLKIIQDSRVEFEKNNKFGVFIEYGEPARCEKVVMIYPKNELHNWLVNYAEKLNVSLQWISRYLVLQEIKKYKESDIGLERS